MARRDWILAAAVGLGAGLAPGCTLTQGRTSAGSGPEVLKPDPDPPVAAAAPPYHVQPAQPRADAGPAGDPSFRRISYPAVPAESEPVKAPTLGGPEPAEPPGAPRELPELPSPGPNNPGPLLQPQPQPDEPLVAALRSFLAKRPDEARQWIKHYDEDNQDMLLVLLPALARLTEGSVARATPPEVSAWIDQLDGLAGTLRPRSVLSIEKLCFCKLIRKFGDYDALPDNHVFRAGSDGQMGEWLQLYVEVHNFTSRPVGLVFETRLTCRVEVRDAEGKLEWAQDLKTDPDRSHSPRHDYFINCQFAVPPHLRPGEHVVEVEVRDLTGTPGKEVPGHRIASKRVPFRVAEGEAPRAGTRLSSQAGGREP